MKVYTTKNPITKEKDKDNVYIVLTEDETGWIHDKKNVCHEFLKNIVEEKVKKTLKRFKRDITIFDKNGDFVSYWEYAA